MLKKKFKFHKLVAYLILAVCIATALFCARYPFRYNHIIHAQCAAQSVDENLVRAIIWTESKFDNKVKSGAGARGLMQLMPTTAAWCAQQLGVEYDEARLYEAEYNIRLGTFYLKYLLNKFDAFYAIAAYNAGEGNVNKWQQNNLTEIPFAETRNYVKRVRHSYNIYRLMNAKNSSSLSF